MSDRALIVLVVAVAAVGGALAAIAPVIVLALLVAAIVVGGLLALGARAPGVALGMLAACLVGYAFFGRAFAYVGAYPLYVGEALLGICALVALMRLGRARFRVIHVVMLAFMALGLARTLPYFGTYGFDALRDGVTWIYCLFAFALSMLVQPHHIRRLVGWYAWIIPLFLLWVPVAAVLARMDNLPLVPGTTVPIFVFKPGDAAVH
ncbi:MAG TPA: hypothetical protein VFX50_08825, partial [Gemmatimonadales bacterium]|nr:hypothetical protein [Gemmatimonadales bacterium]